MLGLSLQEQVEALELNSLGILRPEVSMVTITPPHPPVRLARALSDDVLVFLLARDEDRLQALQTELQDKHGVNVKFSSFDFAASDVYSRAAAVLSSIGINSISVLINNVGFLSDIPEPYLDHPAGYVDRVISVRPMPCLLLELSLFRHR